MVATAAAVLVLPIHLMVSHGLKILPPDGGRLTQISSFLRGYKPPIAAMLDLAGMRYVGPRNAIQELGLTSRAYDFHEKRFEGTPQEVTFSTTRYKSLQQ
jgi:hypothetical protein